MIRRRPRHNRHFLIDQALTPEDRRAYEAVLRDPRTTVKSAHAWLTGRGYGLSESAVARHMRHFLAGAQEQRVTEQLALRLAEMEGSGEVSRDAFVRGAVLRADQLILEAIFGLKPMEGTTPQAVNAFCAMMEQLIAVRERLGEVERSLRGAEAQEQGGAAGAGEAQMNEIADRVREILGT